MDDAIYYWDVVKEATSVADNFNVNELEGQWESYMLNAPEGAEVEGGDTLVLQVIGGRLTGHINMMVDAMVGSGTIVKGTVVVHFGRDIAGDVVEDEEDLAYLAEHPEEQDARSQEIFMSGHGMCATWDGEHETMPFELGLKKVTVDRNARVRAYDGDEDVSFKAGDLIVSYNDYNDDTFHGVFRRTGSVAHWWDVFTFDDLARDAKVFVLGLFPGMLLLLYCWWSSTK